MVIKWRDCVNIREPWRKGHSIFRTAQYGGVGGVGGGGVALTGAAETRLRLPSAPPLGAGGRQDGSSGGAIGDTAPAAGC